MKKAADVKKTNSKKNPVTNTAATKPKEAGKEAGKVDIDMSAILRKDTGGDKKLKRWDSTDARAQARTVVYNRFRDSFPKPVVEELEAYWVDRARAENEKDVPAHGMQYGEWYRVSAGAMEKHFGILAFDGDEVAKMQTDTVDPAVAEFASKPSMTNWHKLPAKTLNLKEVVLLVRSSLRQPVNIKSSPNESVWTHMFRRFFGQDGAEKKTATRFMALIRDRVDADIWTIIRAWKKQLKSNFSILDVLSELPHDILPGLMEKSAALLQEKKADVLKLLFDDVLKWYSGRELFGKAYAAVRRQLLPEEFYQKCVEAVQAAPKNDLSTVGRLEKIMHEFLDMPNVKKDRFGTGNSTTGHASSSTNDKSDDAEFSFLIPLYGVAAITIYGSTLREILEKIIICVVRENMNPVMAGLDSAQEIALGKIPERKLAENDPHRIVEEIRKGRRRFNAQLDTLRQNSVLPGLSMILSCARKHVDFIQMMSDKNFDMEVNVYDNLCRKDLTADIITKALTKKDTTKELALKKLTQIQHLPAAHVTETKTGLVIFTNSFAALMRKEATQPSNSVLANKGHIEKLLGYPVDDLISKTSAAAAASSSLLPPPGQNIDRKKKVSANVTSACDDLLSDLLPK